ncbi:hypothetical protein FUT89_05175 [Ralstonia pseudosolanacearum]|nr:hypothetical protein FUT89_05175 [Ralstonia pseudosolanacearum]
MGERPVQDGGAEDNAPMTVARDGNSLACMDLSLVVLGAARPGAQAAWLGPDAACTRRPSQGLRALQH